VIGKKLEEITEEDLKFLIENGVLERKTIEYKRELNINTRDERKEFLADVSSFANTSGGDLIIGIQEENGIPQELIGINEELLDELKGNIEGLLRDGTEPRVYVDIEDVELPNSNRVLIIRIPKSWRNPHRVLMHHNHFYMRNSNGKYRLDIEELRNVFNLSNTVQNEIISFREDRISNIYSNNAPIELEEVAKTIIHIIPINAFSLSQRYDINRIDFNDLKLIYGHADVHRYNLDGVISYNPHESNGYVQLYRTGIIEAVDLHYTKPSADGNVIPAGLYEPALMEAIKQYLEILHNLDAETPIFIFISLTGVKGTTLGLNSQEFRSESRRARHLIDRDVLLLPESTIEEYEAQIENLMKVTFDAIWNACGYASSYHYDAYGNWNPRNHL